MTDHDSVTVTVTVTLAVFLTVSIHTYMQSFFSKFPGILELKIFSREKNFGGLFWPLLLGYPYKDIISGLCTAIYTLPPMVRRFASSPPYHWPAYVCLPKHAIACILIILWKLNSINGLEAILYIIYYMYVYWHIHIYMFHLIQKGDQPDEGKLDNETFPWQWAWLCPSPWPWPWLWPWLQQIKVVTKLLCKCNVVVTVTVTMTVGPSDCGSAVTLIQWLQLDLRRGATVTCPNRSQDFCLRTSDRDCDHGLMAWPWSWLRSQSQSRDIYFNNLARVTVARPVWNLAVTPRSRTQPRFWHGHGHGHDHGLFILAAAARFMPDSADDGLPLPVFRNKPTASKSFTTYNLSPYHKPW